ncbi:proton-conducting transporter membrane subunit [Sulfoacidibacillus ferrooxidans]|uniref:Hydrogenase-4 component B n=1 Tax=Sulfoacidibacillus ferrooxidans TaxID=2005001 RepID=A0A9X1V785_9BACL|nr:proton-conducting transporter membrane subunit [Sulfoacidibacillus ferrooxidans]MCI0182299.1 Hydrogenase-4 component B [Sulfoacidibacillus ferrooxidans]
MYRVAHVLINLLTIAFSIALVFIGWFGLYHIVVLVDYPISTDYISIPFLVLNLMTTPLSSVFLMILGALGALSSLYGIGYGGGYRERNYGTWLDIGVLLFIAAMASVFLAANVFTFLIGWETMSFVSYLLVIYESERKGVTTAGLLYIAMTQLGTVFIILAFYLLHQYTGSYNFIDFSKMVISLPPVLQSFIFIFTFIGFSLKAGIMPLHIWLPRAHPAAPSHVSALMSGIMLKTALYGLLMIDFYWLHPQTWWGVLLIIVGASSAILGAFHSTLEVDIKRILAYSSIENMGLLFMGSGLALLAAAFHLWSIEGIALVATLYQAVNHAAFKSLLFHGAGSVIHGTQERSLNHLGGLLRKMPITASAMGIGLLAVTAIPPLNGFMSEWLLFTDTVQFAHLTLHHLLGLFPMITMVALLFTGALVALMSARIFGIAFQGEGRSEGARHAHEAPLTMRFALLLGIVLPILLGVFPVAIVNILERTIPVDTRFSTAQLWYAHSAINMSLLPIMLLLLFVGGGGIVWLLVRFFAGKERRLLAPTWTCGGSRMAYMSYSATGFSQPPKRTFRAFRIPVARGYIYHPAWALVLRTAKNFRRIQNGSVRSYLLYLFITVIILLIVVR